MDNNELDQILKDKLKGKIEPSKEFETKIKKVIEEQKKAATAKNMQNPQQETKSKKIDPKWMKKVTSIAAMVILVLSLGIIVVNNNNLITSEEKITVATIKAVEPTKMENGILSSDSEFIIYTEEKNLSKEDVQRSIYIEPALEYTIEETKNSNEYKLTFKQNIPDNTIVKLQYVKNQITENSWAYQTSNKLSVTRTYPGKYEYMYVPISATIEVELSYANVENFEENVSITPAIEGTWEHKGKIWRFIPTKNLDKEATYTLKIEKGIAAGEEIMEEDYILQFSTFEYDSDQRYFSSSISIDGIATYKPDEQVQIYYDHYGNNNSIAKVQMSKFNSADDFIDYLVDKNYEKAIYQEECKFENIKNEKHGAYYLKLNKTMSTGYYVASIQNQSGKELFNVPIQINDLSVYAMESERDIIAWVARDGKLAENVTVEYLDKQAKTNEQGIATFKNITDESQTIKYMKVGDTSNKLVVGIYNCDKGNYPNAYIYTDRPLYKNTDTINIWGFVPLKQFHNKVENEFYIELNNEGKQKVEVGDDGNLNYKIELNNHIDSEYADISLYYKDTIIANRIINIENYELQNYNYELITDRNYVYTGETFEFDVKVTHITGLPVANKNVIVNFDDSKEYLERTNEEGIAHFAIYIKTEDSDTYSDTTLRSRELAIYSGDSEEYVNKHNYTSLYIFNRNTYTDIERKENSKYEITLNKLYKDKKVLMNDISDLYDGIYNTTVQVNLVENIITRFISGYTYNEYTKQNEPEYSYESYDNITKIKDITLKNGKFEIDANTLQFKEGTEDVTYNYDLEIVYNDMDGKEVKDTIYYIKPYEGTLITKLGWYSLYYLNDEYSEDLLYKEPICGGRYYDTYRYILGDNSGKFAIGDKINLKLQESTENGLRDIQNEGEILRIVFQENINKIDIIDTNNLDYTFSENDFPGCKITSAYFIDGRFYRMPVYYFDFDEKDRKVDIEISADKEEYKPGDEVTLKIRTTNNGKGIKSFVNVSVVNEAVFNIESDDTDLLETCYITKTYQSYTYSSYADYLVNNYEFGGGGGGDYVRSNFGDTAHFETVYTDSNGNATIKFKLPDNVTTYRVTAQSANEDMYLGEGTIDITSTLDFFMQYTEPRKVKTTDDLVLNATSISDSTFDVEFEFTIEELNKTLTTNCKTNSIATVNFGKLKAGKYTAIIRGKYGEKEDAIKYQFEIIESAQEVKDKKEINISSGSAEINPTKNPIVLEIYNENMNKYLEYIDFIESTINERLDVKIAYNEVQNIKNKYYGTQNSISKIDLSNYQDGSILKNLPNGSKDLVLTALINYYANQYCDVEMITLDENDNLFEYYLYLAANKETVLLDLLYLKEEKDIDNYNKLLLTLSLEFAGDFQNAKELYNSINLSDEEKQEYASLIAIIDTFINKTKVIEEIDNLIKNNPADEYLRFAILSFFQNNSQEIESKETVTITSNNLNETLEINGMEIKKYTIYNEDLNTINFKTSSKNIIVTYYYQTSLENVENDKITKDITIKLEGELKKNNVVNLIIEFTDAEAGEIKISLPNSLRLARNYNEWDYSRSNYYLSKNNIDYISFYKSNGCKKIEVPLLVTLDGNYTFENVVYIKDNVYHISNSLEFTVTH